MCSLQPLHAIALANKKTKGKYKRNRKKAHKETCNSSYI